MRKPTDLCLLCNTNLASQTNSHIFPRFMGVTMLTSSNNKREGYTTTTDFIDKLKSGNKIKPEQDTPKEDFILCPSCENNFEKLETHFANKHYKVIDKPSLLNNKTDEVLINKMPVIVNKKMDYIIYKKLIYSMLYRASITSLPQFTNIHLPENNKNSIRQIILNEIEFIDYPTYSIIPARDTEYTKNCIYANSELDNKAHLLCVNDYIFIIDFGSQSYLLKNIARFKNHKEQYAKFGLLSDKVWDDWRKTFLGV